MTDIVLMGLLAILLLLCVGMGLALRKSLKKTLYSYENVGYIGGLLFCILFLAVLVSERIARTGEGLTPQTLFRVVTDFPYQFSYFAIPVLFAVCLSLGISNLALIRHEGFRPGNLLSVLLAGFYIGGTIGIYLLSDFLERTVFQGQENRLHQILNTEVTLFLLLMMCYFECILVGCAVMGYAVTKKEPRHDKDFILILGCSIDKKGGLLPLLKGRANRAVRFAWDQEIETGRPCRYIPTGGQGANEIMSEGSAMELYLLSHGAEPDEVFPEKESANTYENMLFSKRILDRLNPGASVAFSTTNFHVFRSGILARQAGLDAEGVSSKTKWYFWPNGFIREFFAILAMNKKAHIICAVCCFLLSLALGAAAYFANLL